MSQQIRDCHKFPIGRTFSPECFTFSHLIIFVINGSVSMNEKVNEKISKGQMGSIAVRDLFSMFKCSSKRFNFRFAVIYYDETAKIEVASLTVRDVNDMRDYNAAKVMGGQKSFVCEGLSLANQLVQQHLADDTQQGIPKSASIAILTAGHDPKQQEALEIAKTIKENPKIDIVSCYIEGNDEINDYSEEMQTFYKELTSNSLFFKITTSVEELRSHILSSIYYGRNLTKTKI